MPLAIGGRHILRRNGPSSKSDDPLQTVFATVGMRGERRSFYTMLPPSPEGVWTSAFEALAKAGCSPTFFGKLPETERKAIGEDSSAL
jgi:hypothetical protein